MGKKSILFCFCFIVFFSLVFSQNIDYRSLYENADDAIKAISEKNDIELSESTDTNEKMSHFIENLPDEGGKKVASDLMRSIDPDSVQGFVDDLNDKNLNDLVKNLDSDSTDWLMDFVSKEGAKKLPSRLEPEQIETITKNLADNIGSKTYSDGTTDKAYVSDTYWSFIVGATGMEGFYLDDEFKGSFEYTAKGSSFLDENLNSVKDQPGFVIKNDDGQEIFNAPLKNLKDGYIFMLNDGVRFIGSEKNEVPSIEDLMQGESDTHGFNFRGYSPSFYFGSKPFSENVGFQLVNSIQNHFDFFNYNSKNSLFVQPSKFDSVSYNFESNGKKSSGKSYFSSNFLFDNDNLYTQRKNPGLTYNDRISVSQESFSDDDYLNSII